MAVEVPQMNRFYSSQQIASNREMMNQGNDNVYGNEVKFGYEMNHMDSGVYVPSELIMNTIQPDDWCSMPECDFVNLNQPNSQKEIISFLGQDVSKQFYQQQQEIDCFSTHHMETLRFGIEAIRTRNAMRLIATAEERMKKKLRSKEEEIEKIGRLNCALEEKVKSLYLENQIWQQMAQTTEDTANVLRQNLHQILTQQQQFLAGNTTVDDVESCCGSNYDDEHNQQRTLANLDSLNQGDDLNAYCATAIDSRWCRNCGKEELCVLLLPCRHLCICTVCESSINFCPICKCLKNASLHVNMSSF